MPRLNTTCNSCRQKKALKKISSGYDKENTSHNIVLQCKKCGALIIRQYELKNVKIFRKEEYHLEKKKLILEKPKPGQYKEFMFKAIDEAKESVERLINRK